MWFYSNRGLKHQTPCNDRGFDLSIRGRGHRSGRDCARLGGRRRPENNAAIEQACNRRVSVFTGGSLSLALDPQDDGHDCIHHVTTEHVNAAAALFSTIQTNGSRNE